jgi:hypothetical protein
MNLATCRPYPTIRRPALGVAAALLGAVVGALALAGCATTGPQLRTKADPQTDFAAYRTYGYVDPLGTDRAGYATFVTQQFKGAVDTEMGARGYRKVDENPDLLVNFYANAEEKSDVRSTPRPTFGVGIGYYGYRGGLYGAWPLYQNEVDTVRYHVGTANVDVVDARRKQLIWEGVAEGRLSKDVMKNPEPAIRAAVHQLFEQFPGRVTPAP